MALARVSPCIATMTILAPTILATHFRVVFMPTTMWLVTMEMPVPLPILAAEEIVTVA
jgi:hypothetical protein